jgi:hypothetical protein
MPKLGSAIMGNTKCPGQDTRFWKPGDIYDIVCPNCGGGVEFFKDEVRRRCLKCGYVLKNPKIEMGCAQWCEHAEECLGISRVEIAGSEEGALGQILKIKLIAAMKQEFGTDIKRINHALKVLQTAEDILEKEKADPIVVVAAALLHDIGIQEAERKHGSSAGKYQELEGPPIARRILEALDVKPALGPERIDHVCRIVGAHHSASNIDTPEFRIIWDADWFVNIPDEKSGKSTDELRVFINKVFRTEPGKALALDTYC